jgi:hypothetical protein
VPWQSRPRRPNSWHRPHQPVPFPEANRQSSGDYRRERRCLARVPQQLSAVPVRFIGVHGRTQCFGSLQPAKNPIVVSAPVVATLSREIWTQACTWKDAPKRNRGSKFGIGAVGKKSDRPKDTHSRFQAASVSPPIRAARPNGPRVSSFRAPQRESPHPISATTKQARSKSVSAGHIP